MSNKYYIIQDIVSHCSYRVYARKGEMVTKLHDHGNVWVVKGENENYFSALVSNLSTEFIPKDESKTIVPERKTKKRK